MSWDIDKTFDFCYGHRVWSQKLKEGFATDLCLACRHLHGHQGQVKVFLHGNKLTDGMVTDFKHLGWFKKWLDETLDHKFIMDICDPLLTTLMPHYDLDQKCFLEENSEEFEYFKFGHYWKPKLFSSKIYPSHVSEMYEGMILVNFVPTSENLSKWLCDIVNDKMKEIGVVCSKIEFNETPKSRSTYLND